MVKKILTIFSFSVICIFTYTVFLQKEFIGYPVPYIASDDFPTFDILEKPIDSWHCINQSACIYSAYWDERFTPPFVRLIAMINKNANLSSWKCLLKYDNTTFTKTPLKVSNIPEGHNKNHVAVYLLCNTEKRPEEVEIVAGQLKSSSFIIQTARSTNSSTTKLAICVRPIFGSFSNNNSIIAEFIGYYQELGADYFTFYDYNSNPSVKHLFYELMENGFPIDFLPWNLPEAFSDAWSYGQMAFSADCLYRNSHNYEFVAIVDIDEFIVPIEDISLKSLIGRLSKNNSKWGTYMFQQTFFCKEYEDDPSSVNITVPLITQMKIRHEKKIWPHGQRSKCIVRPAAIVTPGIHFSWEHLKPWKTLYINANKALLHHYRDNMCKLKKEDDGILETRALRYGKRILDSPAIQVWKTMFHNSTQ